MATPKRKLQRFCAIFLVAIAAAVSSGCAARAEYVYDEPVYRRERVYAPPPVVVYREHHHHHPPPRAYRGRVGVYRAPVHVHRPPPAHHHDHGDQGRHHRRGHDHERHHR